MLSCQNISLTLGSKLIFDHLSFDLPQGENLLILGDSGIGKSSLLSVLTGLRPTDAGSISYTAQGRSFNLNQLSPAEKDAFRAENMGLLFQQFHLIPNLTVTENLQIVPLMSGQKIPADKISHLLARLDLTHVKDQKAHELSQGQGQRLALARALLTEPKWIFCDEPTSALDDKNCAAVLDLIQEEAKKIKASLIIITHDMRLKEKFSKDQTLFLGVEK